MAELAKDFRVATGKVRQMIAKKILSQESVAELHALFQQATIGDCNNWKFLSQAGQKLFDLNSKDKHSTWMTFRGMSKTTAMQAYIDKTDMLVLNHGVIFPDNPMRRTGSVASVATCSTFVP